MKSLSFRPEEITCSADNFRRAEDAAQISPEYKDLRGLSEEENKIYTAIRSLAEELGIPLTVPNLVERLASAMEKSEIPGYAETAKRVRAILSSESKEKPDYSDRIATVHAVVEEFEEHQRWMTLMREQGGVFEEIDCEVPKGGEGETRKMVILIWPGEPVEHRFMFTAIAGAPMVPNQLLAATLQRYGGSIRDGLNVRGF